MNDGAIAKKQMFIAGTEFAKRSRSEAVPGADARVWLSHGSNNRGGCDMQNQTESEMQRITLGDLIVAVTDAAMEVTVDEEEAYEIASRVLLKILESFAPGTAEQLIAGYTGPTLH